MEIALLFFLSLLAGLVDAVSGGGGLIQVPAVMVTFPNHPLSLVFGVNKFASAWGTGLAATRFARKVELPWRMLLPAAGAAFIASFMGARCTEYLNPVYARPAMVGVLVLVLLYTLFKPSLGSNHAPKFHGNAALLAGAGIGAVIGFYDGIFGPGTGSFLVFALVAVLGFDFLNASASGKVINLSTNLAALCYFIPTGNVDYPVAIGMAAANMLGAIAGSHLALSRGAKFIRVAFVVVAVALLARQVQLILAP